MRNILFDMSNMHNYGSAFYEFLELRKHFLVDQLGWKIPHDSRVEMDQYDTPCAHYSLVERDGKIIAGARTQSTDVVWGEYTCMLKDAALGRLKGIPSDIFDASICGPHLWECTRLVVADEVTSVEERTQCVALSIDGLIRAILAHGGNSMISFSPLPLQRTFRHIGVQAERISDPIVCNDDGRRYAVFHAKTARAPERLRQLGIDPVRNEVFPGLLSKAV